MNTIAYQTTLESDTIHLSEAARFLAKEGIITVVELENSPRKNLKNGCTWVR